MNKYFIDTSKIAESTADTIVSHSEKTDGFTKVYVGEENQMAEHYGGLLITMAYKETDH